MNRYISILVLITISSCSDPGPKTEPKIGSSDSFLTETFDSLYVEGDRKSDSIYKRQTAKIIFKGEPGFLSGDFADTAIIKEKQSIVRSIDHLRLKDSLELENEDFLENMTDGGGSLIGYFLNGELVKISEWVGLSYWIMQHNFYFHKGMLIYVRETEDDFYVDDSSGTDQSRFGQHFRGDYYFTGNKVIDMVAPGHNRFEIDTNDPEREFLQTSAAYRKIIRNRLRN